MFLTKRDKYFLGLVPKDQDGLQRKFTAWEAKVKLLRSAGDVGMQPRIHLDRLKGSLNSSTQTTAQTTATTTTTQIIPSSSAATIQTRSVATVSVAARLFMSLLHNSHSSIPPINTQRQNVKIIKGRPLHDYEITATPPFPPDWKSSQIEALHKFAAFIRIEIPQSSKEYATLVPLMNSRLSISKIERIMNPYLWDKFQRMRKDLLSSKTKDLSILEGLGLSEDELVTKAHINLNSENDDPGLLLYADNVALLFHCTRGEVDDILKEGLDERLGKSTGLLGRGIYFADDPFKSKDYDKNGILLMFAVFLGDCLNVDHVEAGKRKAFVREPPKETKQMRNHHDMFFDSITGRPKGVNEYVIYNRFQCVPVYAISYQVGNGTGEILEYVHEARSQTPPFAWKQESNLVVMPPLPVSRWPFYAQTIFKEMEPSNHESQQPSTSGVAQGSKEEMNLAKLFECGFLDQKMNQSALKDCNSDLERTIDFLLKERKRLSNAQPSTSTKIRNGQLILCNGAKKAKLDANEPTTGGAPSQRYKRQECLICANEYPNSPKHWKVK